MPTAAELQSIMFGNLQKKDGSSDHLFHDDYIFWTAEGAGPNHGRASGAAWWGALSDAKLEIRHVWEPAPDIAIAEWTFSGTWTAPLGGLQPNGRKLKGHGVIIHELRDGKLFRGREYYDTLDAFQQLGIVLDDYPVLGAPETTDLPGITRP